MLYTSQFLKLDPYDWFCCPFLHSGLQSGYVWTVADARRGWTLSLSAPEVVRRETPRNRGGARNDREPGGERGEAEAELRHFYQGRHFCTGKRDRIEGIQFLTVGIDMDKIVGF